MTQRIPKKFLTAAEIVDAFGVSTDTISELVNAGELKALPDRGTFKYRRDDIEALIRSGRLLVSRELPIDEDTGFELTLPEGSSSSMPQMDFLELDEEALAEQPTIITGGSAESVLDVPSDSSGDVRIVLEPGDTIASDSDILVRGSRELSSADIIAPPQNLDVSDSDVRISDSDVKIWSDPSASAEAEEASVPVEDAPTLADLPASSFDFAFAESAEQAEETQAEGLSALDFDSMSNSIHAIPEISATEEEDAPLSDSDSGLTLEGADSAIHVGDEHEELALDAGDSGLTLEASDSVIRTGKELQELSLEAGDSGLTLDAGDSGLTLDAADSGLTLDAGDSGLTLDAGDSGLSLEVTDDDYMPVKEPGATQRMEQDSGEEFQLVDENESSGTRRLAASERFAEENQFIEDDTADDETAVFVVDDDDAAASSLSGQMATDDVEVIDELDEPVLGDEEFEADGGGVIEADDEAFSGEMEGESAEDDFVSPVAATVRREPAWGAAAYLLVIAATVLVGVNSWIMWEGVSTMWGGSETSGLANSLISSIASLY